ncbi:hypothetical protein ACIO93_31915 [Streptomyces sp. NPDC087903]|uniref:hypothetical protein n=1 Tax=Streptomyces sp. NPDC087903 TaxID=3365819 RepID=UPI0037FB6BE1
MSAWNSDGYGDGNGNSSGDGSGGYSSGSGSGAAHEPSEDRGQAAWGAGEAGPADPPLPPWASAETQTRGTLPPPFTPGSMPPPLTPGYVPSPATPAYVTPPAAPPYAPPPARPRRAGRVLAAFAAAVVLGAGAGTGVWFLIRDAGGGGGDAHGGAGPARSVTVTTSAPAASSSPVSSPPESTSPPAYPSLPPSSATGYRRAQDPVGFTIDVPEGWTRRQKQGQLAAVVYYDAPAGGRQLQIFQLAEDTPAQSLDLAERDPGYGFARQPGYQVLDRTSGAAWSELTYRYDDTDKGPRQVVDHRFRTADGTLYAIRSSGPERLAPAQVREPLTTALASFCPAGLQCP